MKEVLSLSSNGFNCFLQTGSMDKRLGFIDTLKKVSGMMQGWGKHYWFCNDAACLNMVNGQVDALIKTYVKSYSNAHKASNAAGGWSLMGLEALKVFEDRKFLWPKQVGTTSSG